MTEADATTAATRASADEMQAGQRPVSGHGQPQDGALEPEEDGWENNSVFTNDDDLANSTASLTDSILKYREENGRTYHAYKVPSSFS
jgi:hypothetical protein